MLEKQPNSPIKIYLRHKNYMQFKMKPYFCCAAAIRVKIENRKLQLTVYELLYQSHFLHFPVK
jgi:hypothetical protein